MYGYGYQYSKLFRVGGVPSSKLFDDYAIRVGADGGTIENVNCAIRFINSIGGDLASELFIAYEVRVEADSGTIENKKCLITNTRNLINIKG